MIDAVHVFAALKAGFCEGKGVRGRGFGIVWHRPRSYPAARYADRRGRRRWSAGTSPAFLLMPFTYGYFSFLTLLLASIQSFMLFLSRPALIAVEAEHAAPHLPQGAHRHARGTNRARAVGIIAHEQRQLARGAVRLNRHFIDQVGGGRAPVRQSRRVGVDGDERRAVFAGERLARNGVHAILSRAFSLGILRESFSEP